MSTHVEYRRFIETDRHEVFDMFRGSFFDYGRQIGLFDRDDIDDLEAAWHRQGSTAVHLEQSAAEDWVAVEGHTIAGWRALWNETGMSN